MGLKHQHNPDTVGVVPSALNPLNFWVPTLSEAPYWADLRCFSEGSCRLPSRHGYDIQPRTGLARSFAKHIAEDCRSKASYAVKFAAFKQLCYFLDEVDADGHVDSIEDVNDAHGARLLLFLQGRHRGSYVALRSILARMRERRGLPPLLWPMPPERDVAKQGKRYDPKGIQRLFNMLKRESRDVKLTLREGNELANAGRDPRGLPIRDKSKSDRAQLRANLAWLARDALLNGDLGVIPDRQDAHLSFMRHYRFKTPDLGPTRRGVVQWGTTHYLGKLRWLAPSKKDILISMGLFLLSTGWNLDTAAALDISGKWCRDHPGKPEFKILTAYKSRADRDQLAFSRADAEWRPYGIVLDAIAMTEPLRAIARRRVAELWAQAGERPTSVLKTRIEELEKTVNSPWLYFDLSSPFRVCRVTHGDAAAIASLVREVADIHGLTDRYPELKKWSVSDARDFWIGHVYERSDLDVVTASMATGHADLGTVSHYIGQPQFKEFGERRLRAMQEEIFAQISSDRPLDITKVKLVVDGGTLTPDEELRLAGIRMRTRVGMGCRDPVNPPRAVAPGHRSGELCAIQRCSGCPNGVVFDDSMPRLTRRLAQLLRLQSRVPSAAWHGSSDEAEAVSIDAILNAFDPGEVAHSLARADAELKEGRCGDHATYPGH